MQANVAKSHDVTEIGRQIPDLAVLPSLAGEDAPPIDDARIKELDAHLKDLEVKYRIRLQIADQALRAREILLKEKTSRLDKWANPLTVGVIAGALGLFGTFINGLWANFNERVKLQNDLIKEAIKSPDVQERARSLVFFANNHLIEVEPEVLTSLIEYAGSSDPAPGSSSSISPTSPTSQYELPISFSQEIVDRILQNPGVGYPSEHPTPTRVSTHSVLAIILHTAGGPDTSLAMMRSGRTGVPGPLSNWAVLTDGSVAFVADEAQKANHLGVNEKGLKNSDTIGITATGLPAFSDERQIESLVRLVADVADRWDIPTDMILGHGEASPGRKTDMLQQAPAIRRMVDAIRAKKTPATP